MTARIGIITFPGTLDDVDAPGRPAASARSRSTCGTPTPI